MNVISLSYALSKSSNDIFETREKINMNPAHDETTDDELEFDSAPENGEELNLTSSQREVLTRTGDPQVTALHNKSKRGRPLPTPPPHDPRPLLHRRSPKANSFQHQHF